LKQIAADIYGEPNGLKPRMEAFDRYKWWLIGALGALSFVSPALISALASWLKTFIQP